ncbi:MAG: AI-2E family transporter [Planctomycetota bacterium]
MLERLPKFQRNVGLALVAGVIGWAAWTIRDVLNPLILGYLLAYILRPYVLGLEKRGLGRRTAVNIIFSAFAVVLTVSGVGLIVQAQAIVENVLAPTPEGEDPIAIAEQRVDDFLDGTRAWFDGMFGEGEDPSGTDAVDPRAEGQDPAGAAAEGDLSDLPVPPAGGGAPAVEGPDAGGPAAGEDELTLRQLLRSWAADLTERVEENGGATAVVVSLFDVLKRVFGGVLSIFGFLVLLPVYTYFLLFELERIHDFVRAHVPKRERGRFTRTARQIGDVVANFFRGRLLICFLKGAVISLGLSVAGVPYAFLLGMTSGFLSLVPFVGPTLGFLVTFLISLQRMEILDAILWVAPVFLLAEALEGYVLIPKILGDSLGLHPVVILVSVFAGGAALGLFGFLIAVPLAATAIILFREFVLPAVEDFAEEDSHVDGGDEPPDPPGPADGAGEGTPGTV